MARWKLKGCPRCSGDVYVDRENDNWHEQCLQCGYVHYQPVVSRTNRSGIMNESNRPVAERKPVVIAGR